MTMEKQVPATPQRILMCAPDYFGVDYVINPWMEGQQGATHHALAVEQWQNLRDQLQKLVALDFVPPQPKLPDLVFTANAALVLGDKVIVSRFKSTERQPEEPHFHDWFTAHGLTCIDWPQDISFEGAGDALLQRDNATIWVGYGFRTDSRAPDLITNKLNIKTIGLHLVDPRFYHLDTCFCPLQGGYLLYFPAAFDAAAQKLITDTIAADRLIAASEEDALGFCCNAVDVGGHIFLNKASPDLQAKLAKAGFKTVITPLSEFMKAGGAAKCLTLKLVEP